MAADGRNCRIISRTFRCAPAAPLGVSGPWSPLTERCRVAASPAAPAHPLSIDCERLRSDIACRVERAGAASVGVADLIAEIAANGASPPAPGGHFLACDVRIAATDPRQSTGVGQRDIRNLGVGRVVDREQVVLPASVTEIENPHVSHRGKVRPVEDVAEANIGGGDLDADDVQPVRDLALANQRKGPVLFNVGLIMFGFSARTSNQ